ncbi:MAG: hypothetical protein SGI77_08300 [Pirellulaceae bacterium]|nr:hypothetical protein [Pirellulaceae bacterium]
MSFISIDSTFIRARELYPLPLTAMEQFWLWDDVTTHPKRFRVVIEFSGSPCVTSLEKSIGVAASRHPMLISRVDSTGLCPQWVLPEEPKVGWLWNTYSWTQSPFPHDWDLSTEGGLRIWGSRNGDALNLCFETHHSASDALGLRQFLRDLFLAYDQLVKDPDRPLELPTLDYYRLTHRGEFLRPAPTEDSRSTTTWEKIVGAYHFHFRGPAPIAAPSSASHSESSHVPTALAAGGALENERNSHFFRHTFDRSETAAIDDAHSKYNIANSTLNDAAIALLMQVITDWNIVQDTAIRKQRYRILIPTDLRTLRDSRAPAANRLGFGFVVSTTEECRNFGQLLSSIQSQTQAIRKYRLGLDFVEIFGVLTSYPKFARWIIRRPRCLATAVLTNMGDALGRFRKLFEVVDEKIKIGDLVVESFAGYPPLRPKTHMGVGLSRCSGRLTIGVIFDSTHFTSEQAEELHQQWVQAWRKLPACGE